MTESEDPGPSHTTILVNDDQQTPINHEPLRRALERGCRALGASDDATLSLSLVDEATMAKRKQQAFGIEASTDILSFPIDGFDVSEPGPLLIGDLVLCPQVAAKQAASMGSPTDVEVVELLAHGLLHLAGRDHATPKEEVAMAREQRDLARKMRSASA